MWTWIELTLRQQVGHSELAQVVHGVEVDRVLSRVELLDQRPDRPVGAVGEHGVGRELRHVGQVLAGLKVLACWN